MKTAKVLLIAYAVLLYACLAAFIAMTVGAMVLPDGAGQEAENAAIGTPMIVGAVLAIISLMVGFFAVLFSFLSKKKITYKFIMVIKMSLIPYYVANFVMWSFYTLGFIMVTRMLWIAFALFGIFFTYVTMLITSASFLSRLIPDLKEGRLNRILLIAGIICSFIYFADVIASVLLYKEDKKVLEAKKEEKTIIDAEMVE